MNELLTVRETMKLLGLSRISVYRHIKAGRILAYKLGHTLRISPEDLRAFVRAGRVKVSNRKKAH